MKTFLEVSETGSFGVAAGRLFVTQSAVSLRVQRLEDQVGRPLFDRRNGGVSLTAAGREFRGFAHAILQNWEQARQRMSELDNVQATLALAAQPSLWPRFGFGWLDLLREALPDVAIRAETAAPDGLVQMLLAGSVQVVLAHSMVVRPGLTAEPLMEDQLVMVSPWADGTVANVDGRYAIVDWGIEFRRAHDAALPRLAESRLVLGMGSMAPSYLRNRAFAAYLPARYARPLLADGALHLVQDAPRFGQQSWVIWRDDMDPSLRAVAGRTLSEAVKQAEKETADVVHRL